MVTGLYRRTFEAATFSRASRVIVTSRTYAATSRALWATTPTVIPMAVDARWFNPRAEPGDLRARLQLGPGAVVLYVGRLVRHKGVEYLLEAARSIPGAHFLIVGDGPSRSALEGYARRLGSTNVRFSGRVSQTDLPSLYALADLLILPSISRLEAFGTVALEAMACGRAVVLSDIPGVREVITDGQEGLLFEPMNSEDLAAKVSLLLGDLQLRSEMGARARRKVEEIFNMEKVAGQIEEVYREVVGDRPGHHRGLSEAPKEVTSPP
jgi:glycosyltransferase involved in cell wall biosynthesis